MTPKKVIRCFGIISDFSILMSNPRLSRISILIIFSAHFVNESPCS